MSNDKIKLIFCDMDGTLLDENSNLPPDFDEVIGEVLRRGAIFAPASGRQYSALTLQMEKYADDFVFISENGTFAARHDKELFSSEMDRADVLRILKALIRCCAGSGLLTSARNFAPIFGK